MTNHLHFFLISYLHIFKINVTWVCLNITGEAWLQMFGSCIYFHVIYRTNFVAFTCTHLFFMTNEWALTLNCVNKTYVCPSVWLLWPYKEANFFSDLVMISAWLCRNHNIICWTRIDRHFWWFHLNVSSPSTCESLYCGEPPWPRGSVLGLRPPGLEFRILCLEDSVISIISPSSGGSPGPV